MNLVFERVFDNEGVKINEIYGILKRCGDDMYHNQGLLHWKDPYPIELIKKACETRHVFITKDEISQKFVNTFQIEFTNDDNNIAFISKFATAPEVKGKGIGKQCMNFIETYCRNMGVKKITLDVYEKSEHAINFYKSVGYTIVNNKPTKHFKVYIMEKSL